MAKIKDVNFSELALNDIEEIYLYFCDPNPINLTDLIKNIIATTHLLSSNPLMGRKINLPHPLLREIRVFPVKKFRKFLIFYEPSENDINIIRILHGARDLCNI